MSRYDLYCLNRNIKSRGVFLPALALFPFPRRWHALDAAYPSAWILEWQDRRSQPMIASI